MNRGYMYPRALLRLLAGAILISTFSVGAFASAFSGGASLSGTGGNCTALIGVSLLGGPSITDTADGFSVSTSGIQVNVGAGLIDACTATFTFSRPLSDSAALYQVFSELESSSVVALSLFTAQYTFEVYHDTNPADSALSLISVPLIGLLSSQSDSDSEGPFAASGTGNLIGVLRIAISPIVGASLGATVGLGNSLSFEAGSANLDEAAIPEPSTMFLMLSGGILLAVRSRFSRKTSRVPTANS